MYGIPTRSDVQDEGYKTALFWDDVKDKLHSFNWPTCTVMLNNTVVNAVRRIGRDPLSARGIYEGKVTDLGWFRSRALNKELDAKPIFDHQLESIDTYLGALEHAREYADKEKELGIHSGGTGMLPGSKELSDLVQVEEIEPMQDSKEAKRYTFNPYYLTREQLLNYKSELIQAFNSSKKPVKQVQAMWKVIDKYGDRKIDGKNNAFLIKWVAPFIEGVKGARDYEREEGTEAFRLRSEHTKIKELSDAVLNFEERTLDIELGEGRSRGILFSCLFKKDSFYHGFSSRMNIIDSFAGIVKKKGEITINGTKYSAVEEDGEITHFDADGQVQQIFVNVLGKRVDSPDSSLEPEEWATSEIDLLQRFRAGKAGPEEFLARYEGVSGDNKAEKLESVIYTLNRDR